MITREALAKQFPETGLKPLPGQLQPLVQSMISFGTRGGDRNYDPFGEAQLDLRIELFEPRAYWAAASLREWLRDSATFADYQRGLFGTAQRALMFRTVTSDIELTQLVRKCAAIFGCLSDVPRVQRKSGRSIMEVYAVGTPRQLQVVQLLAQELAYEAHLWAHRMYARDRARIERGGKPEGATPAMLRNQLLMTLADRFDSAKLVGLPETYLQNKVAEAEKQAVRGFQNQR